MCTDHNLFRWVGAACLRLPRPLAWVTWALGRVCPSSTRVAGCPVTPPPTRFLWKARRPAFGAGPRPPPSMPAAFGCLRARRSAALGCLRPLGSALGSGPRPLRRRAFLRSSARGRARPARAHAGHQVRGGRRRVSARGGGRSAWRARRAGRGWPRGPCWAGRGAPGRGRDGGGGARSGDPGLGSRRSGPDLPVGVGEPGRGGRTRWGGVPAGRGAQASSPGPPDAAGSQRPRLASRWVGPGLSPGLNPQPVPPSRHLPGALRQLTPALTHHSAPAEALLPWSSIAADLLGRHPCSHTGHRGRGLPLLGRGLRWAWEQRGLALSPQRRGEDLLADQLHDQRLPWRVHPHRVSRRAGPEMARGGYGRLCAGLPWASRSGPSGPGLGSGVGRGADRAPGLCRPENPDTGGISLTLFSTVLTTILRM